MMLIRQDSSSKLFHVVQKGTVQRELVLLDLYALVRALSIQVQIIKSWYYVLLHQYHALHMSYGMGSNEIPHLQVVLSYQVWIELKIPKVESSSSLTFFEIFQSSRVDLKIPQVELSLTFFEGFFRDKLTRKIYPSAPKLYPHPTHGLKVITYI